MEFFKHLNRIAHFGKINFEKYDEQNKLWKNVEYTVVWYGKITNASNSKNFRKLVEVFFMNISERNYGFIVVLNLPIETVIRMPFGSIWKNNISTQKFELPVFEAIIQNGLGNIKYLRRNDEENPLPDCLNINYTFHDFDSDYNTLLSINNNQITSLIHPLMFFNATYGTTKEINRVLLTYDFGSHDRNYSDSIYQKFSLGHPNTNNHKSVLITDKFSINDALFLHYLKYEPYTQSIVRELNSRVLQNLEKGHSYLKVKPFHQQETLIRFHGFQFEDGTVLCSEILGVSQPQGESIYYDIFRRKKENIENDVNQEDIIQSFIRPVYRNIITDEIILSNDEINNNNYTLLRQPILTLGQVRKLVKNDEITERDLCIGDIITLPEPVPNEFDIGDRNGISGLVGRLIPVIDEEIFDENGVECSCDTNQLKGQGQYCRLLTHAVHLNDNNKTIDCFTFTYNKQGKIVKPMRFKRNSFPQSIYILRIYFKCKLYYILDCEKSEITNQSSAGIIIQVNDENLFLNDRQGLGLRHLVNFIGHNLGRLTADIEQNFNNGKIAVFSHRWSEDNNWILNGIKNLSKSNN